MPEDMCAQLTNCLSLKCTCEIVADANAFSRGSRVLSGVYILWTAVKAMVNTERCCTQCYTQVHIQYTPYTHRCSQQYHHIKGSVWSLRPDGLCSNLTSTA